MYPSWFSRALAAGIMTLSLICHGKSPMMIIAKARIIIGQSMLASGSLAFMTFSLGLPKKV